jgi:hypothetical protein
MSTDTEEECPKCTVLSDPNSVRTSKLHLVIPGSVLLVEHSLILGDA